MINQDLHKNAQALDRSKHRALRLDTKASDMQAMAKFNAFFVAGSEFRDACKEYPVVFVHGGKDSEGKQVIAPVAVFGLKVEQNLCIEGDEWRTRYVPAVMRTYPFAMARAAENRLVLCIDEDWKGLGTDKGDPLFDDAGEPSEMTASVLKFLEAFEGDIERTRMACSILLEKGLLRDMRFDATMPDGSNLGVEGFLAIDEDKLAQLPDADVLAFHKNGLMALIHGHQMSLSNMAKLVDWHVARLGSGAAAPA